MQLIGENRMKKKNIKTADKWFGEHLRLWREDAKFEWSQDELAARARAAGFDWYRVTVVQIESGKRQLNMWEFLWLRILFKSLDYDDFFRITFGSRAEHEPVAITPALVVQSSSLSSFFGGR